MKVEFIGRGSYFAPPFHFTEKERIHKVDKKLGKHLLGNPNFEEVLDEEIKKTSKPKKETQKEVEEKASKEKKKHGKSKKQVTTCI